MLRIRKGHWLEGSLRCLVGLLLTSQATAQFAVTSSNAWDSFIDDALVYTHAVNVGSGDVNVNSIVFNEYTSIGVTAIDSESGRSFSIYGPSAAIIANSSPFPVNVAGQSTGLTPGFVWGGFGATEYSLELNDLEIGQPYQLSLYQAAWNDAGAPNREIDLIVNGATLGTYDVQNGGIEVDGSRNGSVTTLGYTPSTSSVVFNLQMTSNADSTPHVQAFSNHEIAEAPPLPPPPPAPSIPTFADVTARVGLDSYRATSGDLHAPGAVFSDLDNDGFPDLYVVRSNSETNHFNQLYLNRSDGDEGRMFELQEEALGALNPTNGTLTNFVGVTGAVAADYDNDGDQDLYVTNMGGTNRLYQSQLMETGVLSFVDRTEFAGVSGLTGSQHSMTAAWADPDRDGDLDLYVGSHDKWRTSFNGERDTFYMNNGDGTFTDATTSTPGDPLSGYLTSSGGTSGGGQTHSASNAVIFADFNNDQWPDLLVTNKTGRAIDRDMLYINQGEDASGEWQGFRSVTYDSEMANSFGDTNLDASAMGVDVDDVDNDGDLDIIISDNPSFGAQGPNDIFVNQLIETGTLSFEHRHVATGLSWGVQMEDFDNDGFVEVHITNDTFDNSGRSALLSFQDPTNPLTSPIDDIATAAGVENQNGNDRGNVVADFNRDGRLDLFVVNLNNDPRFAPSDLPSVLYENTTDGDNGFLSIKLIGDPTNPSAEGFATSVDAIGSRVVVEADVDGDGDTETMMREVVSGSSTAASTSSLEVEFGMGVASNAVVEIHWADGRLTTLDDVAANQFLTISQSNLFVLSGDFNGDGVVDVADYTLWRDNLGALSDAVINNAGDGLPGVGAGDYAIWRANFGASNAAAVNQRAVPEPGTCAVAVWGLLAWGRGRRISVLYRPIARFVVGLGSYLPLRFVVGKQKGG